MTCGQPAPVFGLLLAAFVAVGSFAATNPAAKPGGGLAYLHEEIAEVPWSVHVVKIFRSQTNFEFHTTLGQGATLGMGIVSEQVKNLPARCGRPVAAINGDFYRNTRDYPGDPEGLQIVSGELVSAPAPSRVCLWIDAAGNPHSTNVLGHFQVTWPDGSVTPFALNQERASDEAVLYTAAIGASTRTSGGVEFLLERQGDGPWLPLRTGQNYTARVREVRESDNTTTGRDLMVLSFGPKLAPHGAKVAAGAVVKISTATTPDLGGAPTAIGGGPTLVRSGKAAQLSDAQGRHPRTAFGWNKDFIFFVEVDGRQRNLSVGMTLPELANYMVKLGCEEAMNLDGGGSATVWVLGQVMNSPSEGQERPAANALVLVDKSEAAR